MAERKMTSKGFLFKSTTKAANSALGFIASHRHWLETGEACEAASPILRLIDEGTLMPTPGLEQLRCAVLSHMLLASANKAEAAIEEAQQESSAPQKQWHARILDEAGNLVVLTQMVGEGLERVEEEKELEQSFDHAARASGWCDRRLEQGMPSWHGEITHTPTGRVEIIMRADSLARILRQKKGAVTPRKSQSTQTLGFQVHAKQTRSTFSHG